MNHIELFSGCGGLSLGLETAGFELLVANELSPMASETFAYNHLGTDLNLEQDPKKVFWVSSQYPRTNIKARLRENPFNAVGLKKDHFSDLLKLEPSNEALKRSLFVGSLIDINKILSRKNSWLLKSLKSGFGSGGVDLVSGGPPCQSFSLAGLRDHTHNRNKLPWEFARFVEKVQPKMAVLENVSGILRAFKLNGQKYYAWQEVAKAFSNVGYVPICLHINAKYVGAAQNRPRFILLAIREDISNEIASNCKDKLFLNILNTSKVFFENIRNEKKTKYEELPYYDIEKDSQLFKTSILSFLNTHQGTLVSVRDALDDLIPSGGRESKYVEKLNSIYHIEHKHKKDKSLNHDFRLNNNKVRARFRIYQIMSKIEKPYSKKVSNYLRSGGEDSVCSETISAIMANWVLDINGKEITSPTKAQIISLLGNLYTRKQTQRALIANEPAPATLSIPDDACHYHESVETQRTLTVREMARIQSFPDWFEIKSKVTTGGQMRKFEVPQYTQVGNAVPPLLGLALGNLCKELLKF
tara:strand:+ start:925 stop:2508 length:1584 start_codon:yes stop_codon:yes gene_type:complete